MLRKNTVSSRDSLRRSLVVAAAVAATASTSSLQAANLHWDGTDSTVDADGGVGTWNLTNSNWDSAATAGTNQIWSNAAPDTATFGGTAGTVTLGSTIQAGGLTFNHTSGAYTLAGGPSSNVLYTGAGAITTTAGGTTNITAPLFLTGSTITNPGALSISSMILGANTTLTASNSNLTIGSVTAAALTPTLSGNGGGEIIGIVLLNHAGVTKSGTGTWTLSNSKNLYTGTTTVSAGTLKVGTSNALGFGASTLSVANAASAVLDLNSYNATVGAIQQTAVGAVGTITNTASSSTSTLTFGAGNTGNTFTGRITDTGSGKVALTKVGSGTQTLSGSITNAFTGGINVNGGVFTLDFANMATPTDLVGATNTLGLGGGSFRITGKAAATTNQTLGNVTVNAGGGQILATNNSASNVINLTLGSLTTTAAGGSLLVGTAAAAGTAGLTITTTTDKDAQGIYGGRTVFFNGTANTGYDWATTASVSSPYTISGYSGYAAAWTTTASANIAGTTDTSNSLINNSGAATVTTTLTGPVATNTLKIANAATNGTQSLSIGSQSLTLTGGGLLSTGSRAYTISGTAGATRLTAGNGSGAYDLVVHQYNSGGLTISAVIGDNGANATSLTKAGGQALTLSGINTFTGRTYLTGGTLNINNSSTTSGTTMAPGTILSLGNVSGLGSGDLTMNGGTFNNSTGSPLTLNNALNISGDVTFNSSALNNITQQTGAVTLTGNNLITVSNNIVTLNGSVGGTGGLFKQGAGTLTLGGSGNNYSGPTVISAGTLNINSAISSDQLLISGGTVNLGASNVLPSGATVSVDGSTGTTLSLGGFNQTIGTLTLGCNNGGGKVIVSGVGSTLTLTGGIITSSHNGGAAGNITVSTLDLNGATQNFLLGGHGSGTDEIAISSAVQNGGINIVGTGATTAVTLSNANTYSGATSINQATLRLGHLNALQNSPLDTSGTGTVTLAAGAGSYTLGGLTGGRNLASVVTGTPTNLTTLVLNPVGSSSYAYSGNITDLSTGMVLTKTGTGTQTLAGTNAYTGATSVNAGTLLVEGSLAAASAVTVGSGATLGGNGTINGSVTVNAGGTFSPGLSPGQIDVGTLSLAGATLMELGGTALGTGYDSVTVTTPGGLNYGGGLTVVNFGVYNMAASSYVYDLFAFTGLSTGDFSSVTVNSIPLVNTLGTWTGTSGAVSYSFSQSTGDLTIVVPEPATLGLLGMSAIGLMRRRRVA